MPYRVIEKPNPKARPSHIPDEILRLVVNLKKTKLDEFTAQGLRQICRAANLHCCWLVFNIRVIHISRLGSDISCSTAMIFLSDNVLLERDLTFDDIKPRLLGLNSQSHGSN